MTHLSPTTLTSGEQQKILRKTRCNHRDHLIYSLALGTGLRLAEIVGLNVGDVYAPDGDPRNPLRTGRKTPLELVAFNKGKKNLPQPLFLRARLVGGQVPPTLVECDP